MVCPSNALTQEDMEHSGLHNQKAPTFNADLCIHCGRCAAVCPSGSLHQKRFTDLFHRVQSQKPRAVVFFCRNLQTFIPQLQNENMPFNTPLAQSRMHDQISTISLPEGVLLEIVRCTGRVGSRLLDKLVLTGVSRVLVYAGPSHACQYNQGLSLVEAQCEGLNSVYEAYGIDARIHILQTVPFSLREVEEQIATLVASH